MASTPMKGAGVVWAGMAYVAVYVGATLLLAPPEATAGRVLLASACLFVPAAAGALGALQAARAARSAECGFWGLLALACFAQAANVLAYLLQHALFPAWRGLRLFAH